MTDTWSIVQYSCVGLVKRGGPMWAVIAVGLTLSQNAAAAPERSPEHAAPVLTGEVSSGIFAGRPDGRETAAVSPRVRLGIRARPSVELGIDFGLATLHQAPSDADRSANRAAAPGNLGISMHFFRVRHEHRYSKLYAGFGFALPTGFADEPRRRETLDFAIAAAGGYDAWNWEPATMSIAVPFGAKVAVLPRLVLGTDAGVAGMFASSSDVGEHGFGAQLRVQARYVLPWFGFGARIQGSYNGRHRTDRTQLATAPFVDVGLCRRESGRRIRGVVEDQAYSCPLRISAAVNVNLDEPYGYVGDGRRIWGGQIALGWSVF